ncbi:hypothetical protein [Desulfonema magnum]|nr:hypothetical protein [Desulfonema magnum]
MQKTKHVFSVILISMLVVSGLPFFSPEDASRDRRVDLQDAILLVKDVALTVEQPAAFTTTMQKTLSALHIVAGLKEHIKPVTESKTVSSDNLFLALQSSYPFYYSLDATIVRFGEYTNSYMVDLEPLTPPPQGVC